jgi:hypothetical protein
MSHSLAAICYFRSSPAGVEHLLRNMKDANNSTRVVHPITFQMSHSLAALVPHLPAGVEHLLRNVKDANNSTRVLHLIIFLCHTDWLLLFRIPLQAWSTCCAT